jgi:alcohol dehydrogenase (cytochrome c)
MIAARHLALAAGALALLGGIAMRGADAQSAPVPSVTAGQVSAGQAAYARNCAACHGADLTGAGPAVALKGAAFQAKWRGKSAAELLDAIARMPPGQEDSVTPAERVEMLALLLQANGAPMGDRPLPSERAALERLPIGGPASGTGPKPVVIPPREGPSRLDAVRSVTAAELRDPPPEDWLMWRRTYDVSGTSPLGQITAKNAGKLRLAWSWSLPAGGNMMTPIVRDGVVYTYSFGDIVEVLDGATGNLLWRFQRTLDPGFTPQGKKGVALAGDLVLVPTSDLHLIALNARTGAVVWDHKIANTDPKQQIKSAPLIAGDRVVIGLNGFADVKGGNFVAAFDLKSGAEQWRFHTIARPGEPGGDSWNGLPLEQRSGGSVWVSPSYDPVSDRVYFGVAPTYDGNALRKTPDQPGVTNDALYTNSTVALEAATGKLAWYYQHQANDQIDHDWTFERTLLTLPFEGRQRRVVMTAGKAAVFDLLDAQTGEYLASMDMGLQNVFTAIDPETGAKTVNPLAVPAFDQKLVRLGVPGICPDLLGARNLMSTAVNPRSGRMYVPLTDTCVHPFPKGERWQLLPDPDSADKWGMVRAIDPATRRIIWTTRTAAAPVSGALATASDVVFLGFADRSFRAFDGRNGRELWQAGLDNAPTSYPVSYAADGKQFVAVATSEGFVHAQAMRQVAQITAPPAAGATLFVFALP